MRARRVTAGSPPAPPTRIATGPLLRIALANCVGYSATNAVPLWLNSVEGLFALPPAAGPAIASAQILLAALCNIFAPHFLGRWPARRVALGAAAVAVLGNVLTLWPALPMFVAGCLVSGAASGVLLAATNRIAASLPEVHRNYSLMVITDVLFGAVFYHVVPPFILAGTPLAPFASLALLMAVVIALVATMPASIGGAPLRGARHRASRRDLRIALLVLGSFALFFAGITSVQAHLVAIGKGIGLDIVTVGQVFSLALVASLGGAAAARLTGERFGIVAPLSLSCAGLVLSTLCIATAASPLTFAAATAVTSFLTVFTGPFVFTLLARLGSEGRWASAGPASVMVGYATGTSVGGAVIASVGFAAAGAAAAALIITAACGLLLAARMNGGAAAVAG